MDEDCVNENIDLIFKQIVIDIKPHFVDIPFMLLVLAFERIEPNQQLYLWLRQRWPDEMNSKRAVNIIKTLSAK